MYEEGPNLRFFFFWPALSISVMVLMVEKNRGLSPSRKQHGQDGHPKVLLTLDLKRF